MRERGQEDALSVREGYEEKEKSLKWAPFVCSKFRRKNSPRGETKMQNENCSCDMMTMHVMTVPHVLIYPPCSDQLRPRETRLNAQKKYSKMS